MGSVLVTGGCGYIGSHTIVDLIENGYEIICVDNNSRSDERLLSGVEKITGKKIKNHKIDLCDYDALREIFTQYDIEGVIHFAAFKSVDESVAKPLLYYHNNLNSQVNLLRCTEEFKTKYFVFSSSCSVYGNADLIPVTEDTQLKKAESPYGMTKQVGEEMIQGLAKNSSTKFILLRYFNPTGAHPSSLIGEIPLGKPSNLVPAITQFAIGKLPALKVFGTDYDTRDGSCIRDFIHVSDIAHAHTLALDVLIAGKERSNCEIYNLGTGNGVTVLEVIKSFEEVSGKKLSFEKAPRRPGDVIAVYANNDKAREDLNWTPKFDLAAMMKTAWDWELALNEKQQLAKT
jgi:UDP-glucose 4-epimerase